MLFKSSSVAVAVSAMFGSALAQSYSFNPNDTALAVRTQWCVQQVYTTNQQDHIVYHEQELNYHFRRLLAICYV